MAPRSKPLQERFWEKVIKSSPDKCWEWTAAKNPKGYGQLADENLVQKQAHRISWRLHFGDPGTLWVLHKCDNPGCVNPNHLFLGTQKDNEDDKISKNRQAKGELNGASKITAMDVIEIRKSPLLLRELSAIYGITETAISYIRNRKKWKHIP